MSLDVKCNELKTLISTYNSDWLLGDLDYIIHAGKERANDMLGGLSSPMRQLYYLAGLNVSSNPANGHDIMYRTEKWQQIVKLLNDIEQEYDKLLLPSIPEDVTEEWKRIRQVAIPSFLSYFNQGPLNFEEQVINWITDLFTPLDKIVEAETGLKTADFIQFYNNLDQVCQNNFQGHSTRPELLRPNYKSYTKIKMGVAKDAPDFIKAMQEEMAPSSTYMSDPGIVHRFYPSELISDTLPLEKVNTILGMLTLQRQERDFLYYTSTKPGNPLLERPILDIGTDMFQVFEVKQVIHAINNRLEQVSTGTTPHTTKYIEKKGNLLEDRVFDLFSRILPSDIKVYRSYYVDGCEQDILILWKQFAFIIETKGYSLKEPFRDPEKAFVRIERDFKACIGYGYEQTRRVEKKFIEGLPLHITDNKGNVLETIDTTKYRRDFSIIVNLESFGQVQCDLSTLIKLENEDDVYPWAVKLDDLEIFILTMIAQKRTPKNLVDFLLMRETLHGKLICSDELEVCGGFLERKLSQKFINQQSLIRSTPTMGDIFDKQYRKGMGFKNEKYWVEKKSGKWIFW